MKRINLVLMGLMLLLPHAGAQAVLLSDLINGGSLTAGDKLFADWVFELENGSLDPIKVDVNPLGDALNPGVSFSFLEGGATAPEGTFLFFSIGYTVTVQDPTLQIVSASTEITDFAITDSGYGSTSIVEEVLNSDGDPVALPFAFVDVFFGAADPSSEPFSSDAVIPPAQFVEVFSEIDVIADFGDFSLLGFEQRFMQDEVPSGVPSPATSLLLLAGLTLLWRRKPAGVKAGHTV